MALAADFSVTLIQMRDSSAVKLETRINGNLAPSAGICIGYRTDNSRDTLRAGPKIRF
jgi:hypothetical protein